MLDTIREAATRQVKIFLLFFMLSSSFRMLLFFTVPFPSEQFVF